MNWSPNYKPQAPGLPAWQVCAIIAIFLVAFGFVSQMDYEDERIGECARKGQDYDRKGDSCVCPRH